MSTAEKAQTPQVTVQSTDGVLTVTVAGAWSLEKALPEKAMNDARRRAAGDKIRRLVLRGGVPVPCDGSRLACVVDLTRAGRARGLDVRHEMPGTLTRLVDLAFAVERKEGSERSGRRDGLLASLGGAALAMPARLSDFLSFIGDIALSLMRLVSGRSAMRGQDFAESLYECGVRSFGIIAVTNLLFGLILAFVGAVQLTSFGAQVYVAGLVGIAMLRVMGAVMVAIVMAGRVGAAYAALIGTMQVNEEVDALETMGIPPVDFLVLPRMLALIIMVPLLTIIADFMGMVGGFLVGITMLGLDPMEYINATISMVKFTHGIAGLVYAAVFGVVIAVFGCYHGMRCPRSAQGVGQATTTAVVHSLVGIIVSTAIITIIFNVLKF